MSHEEPAQSTTEGVSLFPTVNFSFMLIWISSLENTKESAEETEKEMKHSQVSWNYM